MVSWGPTLKINLRASRRARFEANSFEVLIALLCLLAGISALLPGTDTSPSVTELAGSGWARIYAIALGLSATGILVGLWRGKANVEVAGLVMLCTSLVIQAAAVFLVARSEAMLTLCTFIAVAWACAGRARIIVATDRGS